MVLNSTSQNSNGAAGLLLSTPSACSLQFFPPQQSSARNRALKYTGDYGRKENGKINTLLNYSSFLRLAVGRRIRGEQQHLHLQSVAEAESLPLATSVVSGLLSLHLTLPAEAAHGRPSCIFLFLPRFFYLEEGAFRSTGATA